MGPQTVISEYVEALKTHRYTTESRIKSLSCCIQGSVTNSLSEKMVPMFKTFCLYKQKFVN